VTQVPSYSVKRHSLGERAQALSAARDRQHRPQATHRDYVGCWQQRGTEITHRHHLSSLPLPQMALSPMSPLTASAVLGGPRTHGRECPGRDGAVKRQHLPQAHAACVRRQRLLRDAPLAFHRCSFFSSRSYCAPLSTLGSFARLILPGIHPFWTWENNASP